MYRSLTVQSVSSLFDRDRLNPTEIDLGDDAPIGWQFGGDYRNMRVSFLRCYKTCEGDSRCRSFAYVSRQSRCWLKGTTQPRRRIKGVVFGIKE